MVPAELWKWKCQKVVLKKSGTWKHLCVTVVNVATWFFLQIWQIQLLNKGGKWPVLKTHISISMHLLKTIALTLYQSAFPKVQVHFKFQVQVYLLPVPSEPCIVHYFSPVLFKVLKFDLRSFQENWNFVRNKKWYTVRIFASLPVVKSRSRSFKSLRKMRKSFHINISTHHTIPVCINRRSVKIDPEIGNYEWFSLYYKHDKCEVLGRFLAFFVLPVFGEADELSWSVLTQTRG